MSFNVKGNKTVLSTLHPCISREINEHVELVYHKSFIHL